jgi:tetratricopeptide (TPR) repeat protein
VRHFRLPLVLTASCLALALASFAASPPRLQQALSAQRDLIVAEPHNAEALNDFGNLLVLAGQTEAAKEAYRRALEVEPSMITARYNLALLHQERGELSAAYQELNRILAQVPDHAWAWYQVGVVQELRGRQRPAVSAYLRAFQLDPQLTFPDVNPQIIDSKLTGKALLRLDAGRSSAVEAPRGYAQPARVAELLLPPLPEPDENDQEEVRRAGASVGSPASSQEPAEEAERRPEVRVLTLDDLETGSRVGEATPAVPAPDRGATRRARPQIGGAYRPGADSGDDAPPPGVREGTGWGTPTTGRVTVRREDG